MILLPFLFIYASKTATKKKKEYRDLLTLIASWDVQGEPF